MSRNAVQIVYDDGSVQDIPKGVTPSPAPSPSSLLLGGYFDGIPSGQEKAYADQFGMTVVRSWYEIKDWTKFPQASDFARHRVIQSQGLKNLVVFTPTQQNGSIPAGSPPADPNVSATWFKNAAQAANGAVDYWEIWNEPNLTAYNSSYTKTASLWITNTLIPAYAVLHSLGLFVISGGWSGAFEKGFGGDYAINKGLLTNCDAVGFHPYGATAALQLKYISDIRALVGKKPIYLTEWNLHENASNPTGWMDDLKVAAQGIKDQVQAVIHFKMVYNTSQAGVAAPFDASLNKRSVWYDGTVSAMEALQ